MNEVIEWADGSKNDGMTRIHKNEQFNKELWVLSQTVQW